MTAASPTAPPASPPPEALLTQVIFGKWAAMAVSVAAKLRVADELAAGPRAVADLAAATGTHPPSLFRLLRALAGVGVFAEDADGRFRQTPMSEFLRTGVPGSLRGVADYCGADWSWRAWGDLLGSVRTGRTAFDAVFGKPVFEYLADHPADGAVFDEGMTGFSGQVAGAVADAYDFGRFRTVADVGGGHGLLLTTVLAKHPGLTGVVYDQPHVVAGAGEPIRAAGLAGRCRAEGGDFFRSAPAADCYLLKHIIHDWPDDKAATILGTCRAAAAPGATLLLVELVIPPGNDPHPGKLLDLEMLVVASGKERTEAEYRDLLAAAGWRLTRVVPTQSPASVIEAEAA